MQSRPRPTTAAAAEIPETSNPCTRVTFSSSVIAATARSALLSGGSARFIHGRFAVCFRESVGPCASAGREGDHSTAATAAIASRCHTMRYKAPRSIRSSFSTRFVLIASHLSIIPRVTGKTEAIIAARGKKWHTLESRL